MKHLFLQIVLVGSALILFGDRANSRVIVTDTFDVGAGPSRLDDGDDPSDVEWVAISNDINQINVVAPGNPILPGTTPALGSGNTLIAPKESSFGGTRAALPVDAGLTLSVGDKLTLTFDLGLFDVVGQTPTGAGNGAGFRWGLFDNAGFGVVARSGIGAANTNQDFRADTTASVDDNMAAGSGGTTEFGGPNDVVTPATAATGLLVDAVYAASLTAERLAADRMFFTATINGATTSVLDVDDAGDAFDNLSDFSGGYLVIRNGGSVSDFRLDNVRIEVTPIPEPSSAGLCGVLATLAYFGRVRRR